MSTLSVETHNESANIIHEIDKNIRRSQCSYQWRRLKFYYLTGITVILLLKKPYVILLTEWWKPLAVGMHLWKFQSIGSINLTGEVRQLTPFSKLTCAFLRTNVVIDLLSISFIAICVNQSTTCLDAINGTFLQRPKTYDTVEISFENTTEIWHLDRFFYKICENSTMGFWIRLLKLHSICR